MNNMFKILVVGLVLVMFTGCIPTTNTKYQVRERTRYYDNNNHFIGHSIKTSYGERYYDTNGHLIMKSK